MAKPGAGDQYDDFSTVMQQPEGYHGGGYEAGGGPQRTGGMGRVLALGGIVVALLATVGVLLSLTVFASDSDAEGEYRAKVNAAMSDVVSANRSVSAALARLGTRKSISAERAVERAQTATASARGAVNALTVPKGAEPLASNARQTLSREAAYLGAVAATLDDPAAPGAERAETLATNLTDALDVLSPTDADWSQSVRGAGDLTAWTTRNTRQVERAVAARRRRARARASARERSGGTQAPGEASVPQVSGTDCGDGLRAGPNTSCAFAGNVKEAWLEAPGTTNTVRVFSPTTRRTYTLSCGPAGSGITCSGGNNASVSF